MRRPFRAALFAAPLLLPQMAAARQLAGGGAADISLVRVFAALILCLAAAFALALLLRRYASGGFRGGARLWAARFVADRRIEIVETRRISPHADLCLIRCHGREFLILAGQGAARIVSRGEPDQPAALP